MANIIGTTLNDLIPGTLSNGQVVSDTLLASNDTINGLDGNDTISALAGNDLLFGDLGKDSLNGNDGNDTVYGGKGDDNLFGGKGDDFVFGDQGNDSVFGNEGNDSLFGGLGNDTLFAGKGNDSLNGGAGDDILNGDLGSDTMTGGIGNDTFVIGRVGTGKPTLTTGGPSVTDADVITDFRQNGESDLIQLIGGTQFQDLQFIDGTGTGANGNGVNVGDTIIRDTKTGEYLVIIKGKSAAELSTHPDYFLPLSTSSTAPSLFSFSAPNYSTVEGNAAAVTVIRTGNTSTAATVTFGTLDASAVSSGSAPNYTGTTGTLNFAPGQTSATISIPTNAIAGTQPPELFNVVLSGANVGSNPAPVTIFDNGSTPGTTPAPTSTSASIFNFATANYSTVEGSPAAVTVIRTGNTSAAASINFGTVDASAVSTGSAPNYAGTNGTLNFAPGQTSATLSIPTNALAGTQPPELFTVVLSGGNIGFNPAFVSIFDNGGSAPTPTPVSTAPSIFSFAAPNYTTIEGNAGTVTVIRTGNTSTAATIDFTTVDASAVSSGSAPNYTGTTGTLNFAPGQTSATFSVPTNALAGTQPPEALTLVLSGGTVGSNPAFLTIFDNNATATTPTPTPTTTPSLFTFSPASYTTIEGSPAAVTVIRTGNTSAAATISFATLDSTAVSTGTAPNYSGSTGTLNFAPGQTSATISVPTNALAGTQPPELFNVVLSGGNVATNPATVTIFDNGIAGTTPTPTPTTPSIFSFSPASYTTIEGSPAGVTVIRTGNTSAAAAINFATLDGSAVSTGTAPNYSGSTGTLNFAPGQTSATISVATNAIAGTQPPELFNVVLSGGTVGSNPASVTIFDNGIAGTTPTGTTPTPTPTPTPTASTVPSFFFAAPAYNINLPTGSTVQVTVIRSGNVSIASTINYSTVDGTAFANGTGGDIDYAPTSGVLNFSPGQTSATFNVIANPFNTVPQIGTPETANLVLFGGNVINPNPATLNIYGSGGPTGATGNTFFFNSTGTSLSGGAGTTVTVTRTGNLTSAASIDLIVAAGNATLFQDYVSPPLTTGLTQTLSFAAGQASVTIPITDGPSTSTTYLNLALTNTPAGSILAAPAATQITLF